MKQELADCVYQREIGMNCDRGYERGIKVAYEVISDFRWDEEINESKLLRADEINCMQQVQTKPVLSFFFTKDARVDMTILDETYGPMNWQRKHTEISGLFCAIEVWDDKNGYPKKMSA